MAPDEKAKEEKPLCFVIMPISDPKGYEAGHFKKVYDQVITPACAMADFKADRADEVKETDVIQLTILRKIIEAPMAVCDLSDRNPNVMFELGVRQAFGKPVTLIAEKGTPPIFDIAPLRYIPYGRERDYQDVLDAHEDISETIRATYANHVSGNGTNSLLALMQLTQTATFPHGGGGGGDGELESLVRLVLSEVQGLKREVRDDSITLNEKSLFKRLLKEDAILLCERFDEWASMLEDSPHERVNPELIIPELARYTEQVDHVRERLRKIPIDERDTIYTRLEHLAGSIANWQREVFLATRA